MSPRERLPDERNGLVHHFLVVDKEQQETDGYLHIGLFPDGRVGEIFIKVAKQPWPLGVALDCWATAISIALQHGAELGPLLDKFTFVSFEPSGHTANQQIPRCFSVVDYVARFLKLKFCAQEEHA